MNIYLAGRYGRRLELLGYAAQLVDLGHHVTSRWLDGEHEAIDATASVGEQRTWAAEDFSDIDSSSVLIAFTEEPGVGGRGGRHVETGYALGCGKMVEVVGPVENVFHTLPQVRRWETWADLLEWFTAMRAPLGRMASYAG